MYGTPVVGVWFGEGHKTTKVSLGGVGGGAGTPGRDGESAYEIAKRYGFIGTEKQWIDSLKGKDGISGKNPDTLLSGMIGNAQLYNTINVASSQTVTIPADATFIIVKICGGGGGANGWYGSGAGGAAGAIRKFMRSELPSTVSVTIGAGGAAGTSNSNSSQGGNGGTSTFGSYISCAGGFGSGPSSSSATQHGGGYNHSYMRNVSVIGFTYPNEAYEYYGGRCCGTAVSPLKGARATYRGYDSSMCDVNGDGTYLYFSGGAGGFWNVASSSIVDGGIAGCCFDQSAGNRATSYGGPGGASILGRGGNGGNGSRVNAPQQGTTGGPGYGGGGGGAYEATPSRGGPGYCIIECYK